ncbi:MAG TPA: c-type cytochrome [Puia sp.]|nr:c-type cytochrome [Puia sp.]
MRQISVITGLFLLTAAGMASTSIDEEKKHKNLRVLAKDISDDELERVMYTFNRQLGVTCLYCHVPTKNQVPERMDFASDEKREKLIARTMLKMSLKINKKYFDLSIDKKLHARPLIWCRTCHMGYPVPHNPGSPG